MSLSIATYNLCNFGADTPPERLARLARDIVQALQCPALLVVQELVGGDVGPDGTAPGAAALGLLATAVARAGGPRYETLEVAPLNGRDGGMQGANIRVAMLYDGSRLGFRPQGRAGPRDGTGFRRTPAGTELTLNPGRVRPEDPAFEGDGSRHWAPSRKTLAAMFTLPSGRPLLVLGCHLKSMRAETRRAEDYAKKQRHAQATVLHGFVHTALTLDPALAVVVAGDMNDVPGSRTLRILKGEHLVNPAEQLPRGTCYTRRHGGRPQALDHILVGSILACGAVIRIPHLNSDSGTNGRASDHDPVVVTLDLQ